jgi:type IV pilus assembly protein PilB
MADETPTRLHEDATGSTPGGPGLPPAPKTVNPVAELIADLLEPTGLVALDRLATVKARVGSGSFAETLREAGLASDKGVARALATRHHLPFVDIVAQDVQPEALEQIRSAVRERVRALPYSFDGQTLRVAIADPADVAAIDELRLATAAAVELAVAPRDDLFAEITRYARAAQNLDVKVGAEIRAIEKDEEEQVVDESDDLEVDDGVSDAPLVRLVNALIYQAAEDGASDVHVEPQDDCLLVRFRIDGVLQEVQRIPQGACEARHRREAQAAGRAHLAERRGRRPSARHPRRDAADGRGRVGRHASPRQVASRADARGARHVGGDADAAARAHQQPDRRRVRDRADRFR